MFWKSLVYLIFFLFISINLCAQQEETIQVSFIPKWQNEIISLPFSSNETTIETFRCYVTHFELWNDKELVWQEENSYHLLDAEVENSMNFLMKIPSHLNYNQVKFQLGIDSTTNTSGAFGGDLDPTKGMFWAWNTGYINFKLEGANPICKTRKNRFQFHLGGYAAPYESVQYIEFPILQKRNITIQIQLNQFLEKIDLASKSNVMMPGEEAVELAQIAKQIFKIVIDE